MSTKCDAITAAGDPCKAWAIRGTKRCSAHSGKLGAPIGNRNAVKHAFYAPALSSAELAELITHAENSDLTDELAICRVLIRRLMQHINDSETVPYQAVDLVFRGIRTAAQLTAQMSGQGDHWTAVLDMVAVEMEMAI